MNYQSIAKEIVEAIGRDNIQSIAHCATRLRVIVKDREGIDDAQVEAIEGVKGVFFNGGQYQIILGTGVVNKVYKAAEELGLTAVTKEALKEEVKEGEKGVKRLMRILGDIFVPIIPVIAATGLFLGLKGCLLNDAVLGVFGLSSAGVPEALIALISVLTDTAFAFLPALITWSTFRVFGGTPVIGIVIGLMLVSPILPNAYAVADPNSGVEALMVFGFIPLVGCQGSVLTAIMAGFIGSKVEAFFRKRMPNVLDMIFTPLCVMFITIVVILLGLGPIMHTIELGMVGVLNALINLPFGIGGFIIGATYPLAVVTGLHHTYLMIETSLLANTGFNPLITLCAMYGFANVGSCLAFLARTKKETVKATSIGAMLSQLFGISEPVIFGLLIRYNLRPLYMVLISSGVGAAILSIFHIQSNAYGLAVIPSYLMYIYEGRQILIYFIVSLISKALCFALTYLFAVPKEAISDNPAEANAVLADNSKKTVQTLSTEQ